MSDKWIIDTWKTNKINTNTSTKIIIYIIVISTNEHKLKSNVHINEIYDDYKKNYFLSFCFLFCETRRSYILSTLFSIACTAQYVYIMYNIEPRDICIS